LAGDKTMRIPLPPASCDDTFGGQLKQWM